MRQSHSGADGKQLLFSCPWARDRERSWSGTHQAVYSRLCERYDVINFDMGRFNGSAYSLMRRVGKHARKLLGRKQPGDRMQRNIEHYAKVARRRFSRGEHICVQFDECPNQPNVKSFIYLDVSVGYRVARMGDAHGEAADALRARERLQREFYAHENVTLMTMGHWYAKWLVEEYGIPAERVFHVGGGSNLDAGRIDGSRREGRRILFSGMDFPRKNGPLVVEAFELARRERPELELYIVGPESIGAHAQAENVHFEGPRRFSELPDYYNLCDVFCMPSRMEAYGLAFAEALTYGLPCIGRDAFEMPYFIEEGETGCLLRSESAEELAGLILRAVGDPRMKRNVEARREWYLREYSWDAVVERMARVIAERS